MNTARRHVIMFHKRFADAVQTGCKLNTIRPKRRAEIRAGDTLDLRAWSGKPYRSKQGKLREALCTGISSVMIDSEHEASPLLYVEGKLLMAPASLAFARADGFTSLNEMVAWFRAMHGLPFFGKLICWKVGA